MSDSVPWFVGDREISHSTVTLEENSTFHSYAGLETPVMGSSSTSMRFLGRFGPKMAFLFYTYNGTDTEIGHGASRVCFDPALGLSRLSIPESKAEMGVHLYSQGRLSLGRARELANMPLWGFRELLASRRISPHCEEADLEQDVATLREMERL
jgi:predicted HTH domain antitoxin